MSTFAEAALPTEILGEILARAGAWFPDDNLMKEADEEEERRMRRRRN